MKRILLTLAVVAASLNLYGQGTVTFANITADGRAAISNSLTSARVISGTTFMTALYYAPDGSVGDPRGELMGGQQLGASAGFSAVGFINAGTRTAPIPTAGGFGMFQVKAWETAYGATYEEALGAPASGGRQALVGRSNIIRVDTGDPTTVPPGTPGSLVNSGLLGFTLTPVPEPSAIGLGLLGAGALLLLRRRK